LRTGLAAFVIAIASAAHAQNLLNNGTFNSPSVSGTSSVSPGGTTLNSWTVTGNGIQFGPGFGAVPMTSSSQSVQLASATFLKQGGIQQNVTTLIPGQYYTVSVYSRDARSAQNAAGTLSFAGLTLGLAPSSNSWLLSSGTIMATGATSMFSLSQSTTSSSDQLIIDLPSVTLYAVPSYWAGGAAANPADWGTPANWTTNGGTNAYVPSGAGVSVVFGSQSSAFSLVDLGGSDRAAGSISFLNTTGTTIQSVSSNHLTLDNSGSAAGVTVAGQQVINAATRLNSDASINVNGQLTFGGSVSDGTASHGITVNGGGTLILATSNSYSGGTVLKQSALQLGDGHALGSGPLIMNAGAISATGTSGITLANTYSISGDVTLGDSTNKGPLTFTGTGAISSYSPQLTVNSPVTFGGAMSGTGALYLLGPSTLTLGGNNTYTGGTTVTGGTLNLNGSHSSSNNFIINNDAVVNLNGTETIASNGQLFMDWFTSGAAVLNVSGTLNLASANVTLIGQEGSGTSSLNVYSGGVVNVTNGEFRVGNTSSYSPTGILTMYPGSRLSLDSSLPGVDTGFIVANGGLNGNAVAGTVNLNGGTLTSGRNIYGGIGTATFNFNGGLLAWTISSSAALNMSYGTNAASAVNVRNGGAIINTLGNSDTVISPLLHTPIASDADIDGGLTLNDTAAVPGTLTLAGMNTYTGPTNVMAGTLALGPAASIAHSSLIVIGNGATLDVSAKGGAFHLVGGQTLTGTGNLNVAGAMTANSGSIILSASSGLFRSLNVGGLTLSPGSALNYDFGNGFQDLVTVSGTGGLTIDGGGISLYEADGVSQLTAPGTYTLMNYSGSLGGSATSLSVLNPAAGETYIFNALSGVVSVTIGAPSIWTGGGNPTSNWNNSANWVNGLLPSNSQSVTFSGSTGLNNTNNLANLIVGGLSFDSLAGPFVLSGNSIQLAGPLFNASPSTETLQLNIGLTVANQPINAAEGNIVITGTVSGAGLGIVKTGAGTLYLAAKNTYTGGTVVNQGTLQLANSGSIGTGLLTLTGGEVSSNGLQGITLANYLFLSGNAALGDAVNSGPLVFNAPGSIEAANPLIAINSPVTFNGPISGTNGWTMIGPSVATLSGSNTYSGATNVTGGTLQLNASGAPALAGNLVVSGGYVQLLKSNQISNSASVSVLSGVFDLGAYSSSVAGVQLISGTIAATSGVLTSASAFDLQNGTINAVLAGSAGLNLASGGTVTLAAANTLSGPATLSYGTLTLTHPLALQNSTVTMKPGGTLSFAGGNTAVTVGGLAGNGGLALTTASFEPVTLTVGGNNQSTTFNGNLSGIGGLVKTGTGMLTLATTSSYYGATTISGGVVRLVGAPGTPFAGNLLYQLDASNATSYSTTGGFVTQVNDVTGNGNNFVAGPSGGPTVLSGSDGINGLNVLHFNGRQQLVMGNITSPESVFVVNRVTNNRNNLDGIWGQIGDFGIRENFNSAWQYTGGNVNDYATPATGSMYINGVQVASNANGPFTLNVAQLLEASNGNPGFWFDTGLGGYGTGPAIGRFYTGDIGEVLVYGSLLTDDERQQIEAYLMNKWLGIVTPGLISNVLPTTTPLFITSGSTLDLNGVNQQVASLAGGGSVINSSSLAATLTVGDFTSTSFSGRLADGAGRLALYKLGAGTLTLSGSNTFGGGLSVVDGTLIAINSQALPGGTSLTVGDPSLLSMLLPAAAVPTSAAGSPIPASTVPEPAAAALLTTVIAGIAVRWMHRRRASIVTTRDLCTKHARCAKSKTAPPHNAELP
jgi:autotransporter-associated beta strand protein